MSFKAGKYISALLFCVGLQIFGQSSQNNSKDNFYAVVNYFIQTEKLSETDILVAIIGTTDCEKEYQVQLYGVEPKHFSLAEEQRNIYGIYHYKKQRIAIITENGINVKPILPPKSKRLSQISEKKLINQTIDPTNYDPPSLLFFVDEDFNFLETFHNWSGKEKLDKGIRRFILKK